MFLRIVSVLLAGLMLIGAANAKSAVNLEIQKVTEGVYALVGSLSQRNPENLANNATFGVVVTKDGVVLIDPGGSWQGAKQIHDAIKSITGKPVKYLINTGGQDHRWFGNDYFKKLGVKIIASKAAVEDQKDRQSQQLSALENMLGEVLKGTQPVFADTVFESTYAFELGGIKFFIKHKGHAHTPGDSYVWVPSKKTVFAGDIVYVERMAGVGGQSSSKSWIEVFEAMAQLKPEHVVPGHGHAVTLSQAKAQTLDYLKHLRKVVGAHLEEGGDMKGAVNVDQSAFRQLKNFDQLAKRNAMAVFAEMEFE